jgi:hypothetical protein
MYSFVAVVPLKRELKEEKQEQEQEEGTALLSISYMYVRVDRVGGIASITIYIMRCH